MRTPILETERLILRPLEMSDADDIYNGWASDPENTKYMIFTAHKSIEETYEFLRSIEPNLESDDKFDWGFTLKETGELFGSGGVAYSDERGMYIIGYIIKKSMWNKGFTTEAAKAMLDFAINQLGVKSFFSNHAKENIYSGKVMEKVGFVYQQDGTMTRLDGSTYESREYILTV